MAPKSNTINQARYDATHCRYYKMKLHLTIDADVIKRLSEVPSMQGYIKRLIREDIRKNQVPESRTEGGLTMNTYRITVDSFGADCPINWEEIAEALNQIIENREIENDRDAVDALWEDFCRGELADVPAPVFDD